MKFKKNCMKKILHYGFIVVLFLFISSCSPEESIDSTTNEAKKWFTENITSENFEILKYTKEIDWSNAIVTNGEKGQVIEVPFTLQSNLKTKIGDQDYLNYHRLLLIKSGDNFIYNHVEILTKNKDFDNNDKLFNFYEITDDFDGIILVLNPKKEAVQFSKFKNSILVKPNPTGKMESDVCVYMGWLYEDGDFEALMLIGCFGGGGGELSDNNGGYPPHVGGGGSGASALTNAQKIEKQINSDKLDACTKAVFDKLKNLKQTDIAGMIESFRPGGAIFNLNMSTGKVSNPNDLAQTTKINGSKTDISMVFKEDYINGVGNVSPPTDLSVATTMAHEIIHAYLISLLEENTGCGNSKICDFPTIYDAYVQQQISKNPNLLPNAHHELIANKYVNSIASAIQEFHTGQPVDSGFPMQVYLDMAWGGLQGTRIFNQTYPNDPSNKNFKDRERILYRINTEKNGSQYGIYSPVGKPCKK